MWVCRWYSLGLTTAVDDVKYAVGLKPDNDQDEATDKDGTRKGPGRHSTCLVSS